MKNPEKKEDYISGPHHYWLHFICGFVFGAFVGGSISSTFSERGLLIFAAASVTGLCFGLFCGKWGEQAWKSISEWFRTWWQAL